MIVWFHNKISICWRDIFLIFHDLVMMLVSAIIYEILSYSYFLFFSWFSWIFEIFHYFLNSPFSSFQMETEKQTRGGEGSPGKGTYGKIPLGGLLSLRSPPLAPKLGLSWLYPWGEKSYSIGLYLKVLFSWQKSSYSICYIESSNTCMKY